METVEKEKGPLATNPRTTNTCHITPLRTPSQGWIPHIFDGVSDLIDEADCMTLWIEKAKSKKTAINKCRLIANFLGRILILIPVYERKRGGKVSLARVSSIVDQAKVLLRHTNPTTLQEARELGETAQQILLQAQRTVLGIMEEDQRAEGIIP
jgi:hypothetical protein